MSFRSSRLILAVCVAALLVLSLASCQTVGYYSQAAGGQMQLWRAAKPIDELLEDENTDPLLRQRLELVSEIRAFAIEELSLPDNGSYRSYADLERPYVIWNVFAAPALSLDPMTWCFPIAGCVGYRGYFSEQGAQRFAERMRERGFDVYVGGVPAYSTLVTGQHPVTHGVVAHGGPSRLAPESPCLPESLLQAGYTTALFGNLSRGRDWLGRGYEYIIDPAARRGLELAVSSEQVNARGELIPPQALEDMASLDR